MRRCITLIACNLLAVAMTLGQGNSINSKDSIYVFFLKDSISDTSFSECINYVKSSNAMYVFEEREQKYYVQSFHDDIYKHDSIKYVDKWELPPEMIAQAMDFSRKIEKKESQPCIHYNACCWYYNRFDYPLKEPYSMLDLKRFIAKIPGATFFYIYEMPLGLWCIKDQILFKVLFKDHNGYLMDGDKYFKEMLQPLSPDGLKRVLEGNDFYHYVVK